MFLIKDATIPTSGIQVLIRPDSILYQVPTNLQIDPSFLLNFVVIDGKVTHFCPNLTTFVPTIRNIYEDMIEIGLKHTSELTVSEGLTAIQNC